jgi:hypothetical protein
MSGEFKRVWRGIVDDLFVLADFCDRKSPLSYQGLAQNAASASRSGTSGCISSTTDFLRWPIT